MASNITTQSVLDKVSQDHLECPICRNRYTEPKQLDCHHSFCLKCLQQVRLWHCQESSKLRCPLCRHDSILMENRVSKIPDDLGLSALLEEVSVQEKLLQCQGSEIKCQACDEDNQSFSRCMDCDNFLCQDCQKAHGLVDALKSHRIHKLAQVLSSEIPYKSKLGEFTSKCNTHTDQNLSLYCNICETIVCLMCSIEDHLNPKHSLVSLPQALDKLVATLEKSKSELNDALSATEKFCKRLETMFAETNEKISKKAEKEIAKNQRGSERIREEEQKLKQKAEQIYKDRLKISETALTKNSEEVAQIVNRLDEVNQLMVEANWYDMIDLEQKLIHHLKVLPAVQPEEVSDSLSFMDFEEGDKSLGRLVLEDKSNIELPGAVGGSPKPMCPKEKWVLKTDVNRLGTKREMFKLAYDVAAFSNNEIVILYIDNKLAVTFKPPASKRSSLIPQRLEIKGVIKPRLVRVNKEDQLIVLDNQTVKIFNREYQLLHEFTPGRDFESKPTCLAVDDINNQIAVGYKKKNKISLHNPDGSLIRTLTAPRIGRLLTICKHRFIYTTCDVRGAEKLVSLDHNGEVIFSVDIHVLFSPNGLCCGRDDIIYVAVYSWPFSGGIHRFSLDGVHIDCIIRCLRPHGITFRPSGELVMAARESVQIYHRV